MMLPSEWLCLERADSKCHIEKYKHLASLPMYNITYIIQYNLC